MKRLTRKQFFDALRRRGSKGGAAFDRRIEAAHLEPLAVLMSDSSGFSRKTHEHGILQFLAVMTESYDRLIPLIRAKRGTVVSHGADNILAVFADPADAVAAADAMRGRLKKRNRGLSDRERFNICIGIDYGPVIRLKDDVFGEHVNLAAKIGEDLASADEILVTKSVADRAKGRFTARYARSTEIGGKTIELYRVVAR